MNHSAVLRLLAFGVAVTGLCAAIPLAAALVYGDYAQALGYGVSMFIGIVPSTLILVLVPRSRRRTAARDLLAVVIGWWLIAPLIAMPGFLAGVGNSSMLRAWFDATSCLTTTGTAVSTGTVIPPTQLVWRGVLHLLGAIVTLAAALAVLPALNLGGAGMHRSRLFSGTEDGLVPAFIRALRVSAMALVILWILVSAGFILSGLKPGRGFTLAMSVITTGLVDPVQDLAAPRAPLAQLVGVLGLMISAFSITLVLGFRGWPMKLLRNSEAMMIVALVLLVGVLVSWLGGTPISTEGFAWAASHIATSGVMTQPMSAGLGEQAVMLAAVLTFIGGSALSTAGGIKMARVLILSERSRLEFSRLGFQNSVNPFIYRGQARSDTTIVGIWVYLVCYIVCVMVLALALSLPAQNFEMALVSAIGLICNAGHLVTPDLANTQMPLAGLGMVLGRVEVLALLAICRPSFWRI